MICPIHTNYTAEQRPKDGICANCWNAWITAQNLRYIRLEWATIGEMTAKDRYQGYE
jgi:hypothetical protein